jgi:hypothetical protein
MNADMKMFSFWANKIRKIVAGAAVNPYAKKYSCDQSSKIS